MKISIVTPCFNSAKTIAHTIRSVNSQTYPNIEHIFIDGASTDHTVNIIKQESKSPRVYSEKDRGIYDAMNKGFALATGDIVGILNSDDWLIDSTVLERIAAYFHEANVQFVCAQISFFSSDGSFSHNFGKPPTLENNIDTMAVAHPSVYMRRQVFAEVGEFNRDLRIAADYDWCLRLLKKNFVYQYDPGVFVGMSLGGASSKYISNKLNEELAVKLDHFPSHSRRHRFFYWWSFSKEKIKNIIHTLGMETLLNGYRNLKGIRKPHA